jgi:hemoglobin
MFDFWEMVLFDGHAYKGNPMKTHLNLNEKSPLKKVHFDAWIDLFNETVNELFEG